MHEVEWPNSTARTQEQRKIRSETPVRLFPTDGIHRAIYKVD